MSIFHSYLKDRPYRAWRYDGSSYVDAAGSGSTLTAPAPSSTTSIVVGSKSPILIGPNVLQHTLPDRFRQGYESKPFTLEAWVDFITASGSISILSHTGVSDGLYFDGDRITFTVNFNGTGSAQASWPVPDFRKSYHVVGVYDGLKVELFVNGVLESATDLNDDQRQFTSASTSNLYSGQTVDQRAYIDGIALYGYALSSASIQSHFVAGRASLLKSNTVAYRNGNLWDFTDSDRDLGLEFDFDWNNGTFTDIGISDYITPIFDDLTGLSMAGIWQGFVPLSVLDTTVQGIKLEWDGDGTFVVERSLDNGVTWSAVQNGSILAGTVGVNPAELIDVDVRILFPGGIADDPSQVRRLHAAVYLSTLVRGTRSVRTIDLIGSSTTATFDSEPIERYQASGLRLNGGYGILSADTTETPETISTIEFWVKFDTLTSAAYLFDARPLGGAYLFSAADGTPNSAASTVYINGKLVTAGDRFVAGEWTHVVATFAPSLATSGVVNLGANNVGTSRLSGQIAMFATYTDLLSAPAISNLYSSYLEVPKIEYTDTMNVRVTEQPSPYLLYDYDWSIQLGI